MKKLLFLVALVFAVGSLSAAKVVSTGGIPLKSLRKSTSNLYYLANSSGSAIASITEASSSSLNKAIPIPNSNFTVTIVDNPTWVDHYISNIMTPKRTIGKVYQPIQKVVRKGNKTEWQNITWQKVNNIKEALTQIMRGIEINDTNRASIKANISSKIPDNVTFLFVYPPNPPCLKTTTTKSKSDKLYDLLATFGFVK